jgi:hypothetical protein
MYLHDELKNIPQELQKKVASGLVAEENQKFSGIERIRSEYRGIPNAPKSVNSKVGHVDQLGFLVYYRYFLMKRVATLGSGRSFGAMALKKKKTEEGEGKRMASILAEEDMTCIVLSGLVYNVFFLVDFF